MSMRVATQRGNFGSGTSSQLENLRLESRLTVYEFEIRLGSYPKRPVE